MRTAKDAGSESWTRMGNYVTLEQRRQLNKKASPERAARLARARARWRERIAERRVEQLRKKAERKAAVAAAMAARSGSGASDTVVARQ